MPYARRECRSSVLRLCRRYGSEGRRYPPGCRGSLMSAHRQPTHLVVLAVLTAALAVLVAVASPPGPQPAKAAGTPTTILISRAIGGGAPNGPSTNPVISNDKRYARAVAFQSEASNLVRGDTNGVGDVF